MGHRAEFKEKLIIKNKEIYRVVYAYWKKTKLRVIEQRLGANHVDFRNLNYTNMSGWIFNDPSDRAKYYSKSEKYGIDQWWSTSNISIVGEPMESREKTVNLIISIYPDFKYLIPFLADVDNYILFNVLEQWKQDKRVELLIKCNQLFLALKWNKGIQFDKLPKEKRNVMIRYLNKNTDVVFKNMLAWKLAAFKGITNYELYFNCSKDITLYHYLTKQKEDYPVYKDYLNLANRLNKNLHEDYWLYPKDLRARHNKLLEEKRAIEEAENELANKDILKVSSWLSKRLNATINGYQLSVPIDYGDIREQANVLHQCLIYCEYYKKYAEKKSILIFIKKDGVRLATAELFYDKEKPVWQFYGDESDRKNCLPSPEIKEAFNYWKESVYQNANLRIERS